MSVTALRVKTSANSIWTGKEPVYGVCPGVLKDGTITSLPQLKLDAGRQAFLDYFNNGWTLTEVLFSGLASDEAFYQRPYHHLRHPMIFYYGHPVALYVNKLRVAGLIDGAVNPQFESLFETGVDEMRWDDMHENTQHVWPTVDQVRAYRKEVYDLVCNLINTHPALDSSHPPITQESPLWALVMAFEHERIHLETSSVLIRELPIAMVRTPEEWPHLKIESTVVTSSNRMIQVASTKAALGKPHAYPSFGWDNEYGQETRSVSAFSASECLISNRDYHHFVTAGGYRDDRYWSADGLAWRRFRNIKHPTFWVKDGPAGSHQYKLRTIFEVIDMQWDWPVCVNYYEAKAYCAWRTQTEQSATPYRLLTEAEHHALRDANNRPINANLTYGSEVSVKAYAANDIGFHDVHGNLWQWCEDHFHPLQGFQPHPYYDDFSTPCFDGEHQMILGGSFISTGDESSPFARFHFRPHFFQHAGFRLVQSGEETAKKILGKGVAAYESKEMINKYLLMHYGSNDDIYDAAIGATITFPQVAHLPLRCAELVHQYATSKQRVLDLGCAVGRSAFELAREFQEVVGIDYSHEFIAAANKLQQYGTLPYLRKDSGDESVELSATIDASIDRSRITFMHGDACALPESLAGFDAVLLANVLCRLPQPLKCLERLQGDQALVKKGGVVVMATPFSWLPEYTPSHLWLRGIEAVQSVLTEYELVHQEEIPFMIREHRRKFEYIVTLASVWRRKG